MLRSKFIAAIEAGIAAAPDLAPWEKLALRTVGSTAKASCARQFDNCPMTQIGIDPAPFADPFDNESHPHWKFIRAYDSTILGVGPREYATPIAFIIQED
jgi:hypothetical protein